MNDMPRRAKRPAPDGGIPFIGMALVGCLPSPLKRVYYRWRGARIGKGVSLGLFSYIQSPDIVIGDNASIAPCTFIRARTRCHIGARSRIHAFTAIDTGIFAMGEDSAIGEQVVVGGIQTPRSALIIGDRTKIFSFSFINPTEAITIGDEVCVGGGSYLFTHGTWQSMLDGFPGSFGPITIEDGSWLGWRGFVMPHVTIGKEATVGAGSVVTRSIPTRQLAVGAPARVIKTADEYIRKPDAAGQHALLIEWLEEYTDFLKYLGKSAMLERQNDGTVRLVISQRKSLAFTVVYRQHAHTGIASDMDALLSLTAISEPERDALNRKGHAWFDIAGRECGLISHPLCAELRNFLSRYGVRFKVVSA